jgi:hypothetical protein
MVWGKVANNGSEVAMGGALEVVGVTIGTTKLDRFKGLGFVEGSVFGNKFMILRHEPLVE